MGCAVVIAACGGRTPLELPPAVTDAAAGEIAIDAMRALDVPGEADTGRAPDAAVCSPGQHRACYDGPTGTEGVGTCQDGQSACSIDPSGAAAWGPCVGEVLPATPQCDNRDHACTGAVPRCDLTVTCSSTVTTLSGTGVSLSAAPRVLASDAVASETWSLVDSPAGSSSTFSTTTGSPTVFTPHGPGRYMVRFVATDTLGHTAQCDIAVTAYAEYLGTEFWSVVTANSQLESGFDFAIGVGNANDTPVDVRVTGGALTAPLTFRVPANSASTQALPWVQALSNMSPGFAPATSALAVGGAYHVTTSAPVSMYQFNPLQFEVGGTFSYTNDASLLLPVAALTPNYVVLTHEAWYTLGDFVAIVGTTTTPTTVTVHTTAPVSGGLGVTAAPAGSTLTYTLQQGDVVQLVSLADHSCTTNQNYCPYDASDLTGTTITATGPVAVFSGNDCSNISGDRTGACPACDHLEQQLFPLESWGSDVFVSQLQDRSAREPYQLRVIAARDGTTVAFVPPSAHATATLAAGESLEFCATTDVEVLASQPILVGQFMVGQNVVDCGSCTTTPSVTTGDPSFVLEVPVAQYRHSYSFIVPSTFTSSFINVVGAAGSTIILDGTALVGSGTPLAGTAWSVWRQAIAPGAHTIATSGASPFGLKVLGVASYTSYAYPGGLSLSAL